MPENEVVCTRCNIPMKYLKEYRFDSQDTNRGLFGAIFDVEEHLTFDFYVCPRCNRSEFYYTGSHTRLDG